MICPQCGTENLKGKMICYKCGARLITESGPVSSGKKKNKKSFGPLFGVLFILIVLGTVLFLMFQLPGNIPSPETSPQAARNLEKKLDEVERYISSGKSKEVAITEEELNSIIAEQLGEISEEASAGKNVKLDGIRIQFEDNQLKSIVAMKVKGKLIYLSLTGKVNNENGKLTMNPDKVKIGKLPVPAKIVRRALARVEEGSLSFLELPSGVTDIRIEEGTLILKTEAGEVKSDPSLPASARKKPMVKRNNGNEAKSWLQVGNNFINIKAYDSALEYYQKVITKYPESPQAEEARKRVEEIMKTMTKSTVPENVTESNE